MVVPIRHFKIYNNKSACLLFTCYQLVQYICNMKDYFIRMFGYDRVANLRILNAIEAAHQSEKPMQLMAHLLAAQQVWLKRCKCQPAPAGPLWPQDWTLQQMLDTTEENYQVWLNYLQHVDDSAWQNTISYQNFKGENCSDKLVDILAHLINHGTHHRAQAGQHLKLAGLEKLPATDFILYAREQL